MIQLRKSRVVVDSQDVERLNVEFQEKYCVLLPKLLEPALLDVLLSRLEQGEWCEKVHEGIGTEVILDDLLAVNVLHFVANSPSFLDAVRNITECAQITWFGGRVYRFVPNSGHYDSWHNDAIDDRLVGMSLNLSPKSYKGGLFQLKERSSDRMLTEVANTGWGDAILFRISERLLHQVTEVEGVEPKTAFAGWFQSGQQNFRDLLRENLSRCEREQVVS
jgi:hypothetical protein